jgi:hypothetical protein
VETTIHPFLAAVLIIALMPSFIGDLRFGARMLAKNPGFTLAAIAVLAVGIGANTAIFTVTSGLLLRPFPYSNPQQLVSLSVRDKTTDFGGTLLRYETLRDRSRSFDSIAVWTDDNLDLTGNGEPQQVPVARVTANFFNTLGVQAKIGRTFTQIEGSPEGPPVAIITDSLWRSRFAGDPNLTSRTVTLDGVAYTIVGVLPAGIQFPFAAPADIWIPRYFELSLMTQQRLRSGVGYLNYLARLRTGVSPPGSQSGLAAFLLTRLMLGMLYKVSTHDSMTFVIAPLVFLFVALVACYLPARRATKVDSAQTLRQA